MTVDEYVFDTWTNKTNMPSPARRYSSAFTIGEFGFAAGGNDGSNIQDTDKYDQIGDSWISVANIPTPARERFAGISI